jgi:hypothetical protein
MRRLSNKPIRRLVHSGALGRYVGHAQLGDTNTFLLNPSQVADLESRHAEILPMMGGTPPSGDWAIGYQVTDPVYGNVLISLDASNRWNFVGASPISNAVVNAPPYQSPVNLPGSAGCTDSINDFLGCVEQYAGVGLVIVGGIFLYKLVKK